MLQTPYAGHIKFNGRSTEVIGQSPGIDFGYSTTVPYISDITYLFAPVATYDTYFVETYSIGNHSVNNYSTSTWVRSYRTIKYMVNTIQWTGSTWTILNATVLQTYASSTNWAAGAGNAGFARILVSGTQLQFASYEASAAFVDNGTQRCSTSVTTWINVLGTNTRPWADDVRLPPVSLAHSPIENPARFTSAPPPGPPGVKVICSAMNDSYGFGGFRSKVWLKYSEEHLTKYHEIGYHLMFKPLVKISYYSDKKWYTDTVKAVLEELVTRRTKDIWQENRGKKRDWRGRIYRGIFEPLCYMVGFISEKLKESKK